MRKSIIIMAMAAILAIGSCGKKQPLPAETGTVKSFIEQPTVERITKALTDSLGEASRFRIERGVSQAASLWRESDGTSADFEKFCKENFVADDLALETLYKKLERNFEIFRGYFHKMDLLLKEPIQITGPEIEPVDMMFGSYDASAHLDDDLFNNKIGFLTALNFPFYSLKEKTEKGATWSRREWAYARMGDRFTSRVPADILTQSFPNADRSRCLYF